MINIKLKKLEKETVWKKYLYFFGAVSFFIFIFPYFISVFQNGMKTAQNTDNELESRKILISTPLGEEEQMLEEYLIGALAQNGAADYEAEAIKALAVVLRSNTVVAMEKKEEIGNDSFYSKEYLRKIVTVQDPISQI